MKGRENMKILLVFDGDLRLSADQNCCESGSKINCHLSPQNKQRSIDFQRNTITNQTNKL
ncbi:hypothetical protein D3C87_115010 [compost metagenome]